MKSASPDKMPRTRQNSIEFSRISNHLYPGTLSVINIRCQLYFSPATSQVKPEKTSEIPWDFYFRESLENFNDIRPTLIQNYNVTMRIINCALGRAWVRG